MSASSILLVAATIVAVDGDMATIDAGKAQHLESGDRGQAFYELLVDGVSKRIEVGPVTVITTGDGSSTVLSESRDPLRPGYRVELRLPPSPPGSGPKSPLPEDYPVHTLPAVPVELDSGDKEPDSSQGSIFIRRFMDRGQRNSRVGFRCVKDPD